MWAHMFGEPETATYEKERETPALIFRPKRILPRRFWGSSSIV